MSWSLNSSCWKCKKGKKCIDYNLVQGSIDILHHIGAGRGHEGAGMIELQCQNIVETEEDNEKPILKT